ncbi:MAG: hypothetical protein ACXWE8_08925 [Solirubrobacterales bacterium]
MPEHSELIELEVGAEEALATCRAALESSGWEITEETAGELRAREEAWRLDCRTSPSRMEVCALDAGDATTLSVRVSAPGIGPIPGPGRLRRQVNALRVRIAEATASQIA